MTNPTNQKRYDDIEDRMRMFETFHKLKLIPNVWSVLRIDGRCFSKYTAKYAKPFDISFHEKLCVAAQKTTESLGAVMAYIQSDEVSILFKKCGTLIFDGEVEKLVSVSASLMASNFTAVSGDIVSFDSRLISLPSWKNVADYFIWRHNDALRNSLYTYAYWALRASGESQRAATKLLLNQPRSGQNEILFRLGTNFNDVPVWTKRGSMVVTTSYLKDGFNPITKQSVKVQRKELRLYHEIPTKSQYNNLITAITEKGSVTAAQMETWASATQEEERLPKRIERKVHKVNS